MNFASMESGGRARLFWQLQIFGWGGAMILTIGIGGFIYSPIGEGIWLGIVRSLFGLIATSFLLRPLLQHLRVRRRIFSATSFLVTAAACGLLGFFDTVVTTQFAEMLPLNFDHPAVRPFLAASGLIRSVLYGFWCVLYVGIHYWIDTQQHEVRAAKAEAAARASELQALRAQVNPHFLFNALNSILAESSNAQSVRRITLALADYLRFSLQQRNEMELLGVELAALENYLRVEKFRFEDDFEYEIRTDAIAPQTLAPVALVQPLLENAIKYGQRSSIRPLRISIDSRVEDHVLEVMVTNSGQWQEEPSSPKTGLANLRRRLALLCDDRASLAIDVRENEVLATVRVPVTSLRP